jgi:hypothetical protein
MINLAFPPNERMEQKFQFQFQVLFGFQGSMQAAIDRFVICGPLPGARSIKFEIGCPPGRYHAAARSSFSVPRATILSAWSGKGRCNAS